MMPTYPTPAEASSLAVFGRETPVDGDLLALHRITDRWQRQVEASIARFVHGSTGSTAVGE